MSSSKIIKSDRLKEHTVCSVSYGDLTGTADLPTGSDDAAGFMPLIFRDGMVRSLTTGSYQDNDSVVVTEGTEAPDAGGFHILEEELQQRLDEAFQRGVDEGRQLAERGLANVFKSLREGIAGIAGLREKVLRESEDDLLKLSIMVARKVIQQEVSLDPQILARIVSATISCCSELDRLTIRLNPDDYSLVTANRQLYLSGLGKDTHITFIPDETVLPGGCMVDTATGTIDARIDVQLDEIYRRFMEERGLPVELTAQTGECQHVDE